MLAGIDDVGEKDIAWVEEAVSTSCGVVIPGIGDLGGRVALRLAEIGFLGAITLRWILAVGMSLRGGVEVISRNAWSSGGTSAALLGAAATARGAGETFSGRDGDTITSTVAAEGEETHEEEAMVISASENVLALTSAVSGTVTLGDVGLRKLAGTGFTTLARGFEDVTGGSRVRVVAERTASDSGKDFGITLAGPAIADRIGRGA